MSGVVSRLFGLAPAPSTSSEYTKTARADAAFCDAKPSVARAFCREDLPDARAKIVAELRQHLRRCSWSRSAPAAHWSQFVARPDTRLWAVRSRFMRQRESAFEREYGYSQTYPNASVSMTDYRGGEREDARMEHCDTPEWTFERVGPFAGRGQLWHSAGWRDAGGFGAHLARATAPMYVTAFGFHPTSSSGEALGYPPVMIHHMHVTSSQSMARDTRSPNFLRRSRDGFFAVEFDVHGDRQCAAAAGGVNCTVRAFPPGFGLRITDTMETFFDLNDVRDAGSAPLQFYAQHSYRWTRAAQRPVGKMLTLISTEAFKPHDDYLLEFDPEQPTEYLYWQEGTMPASLSMVHMYWHAHHAWTDDIWLVDASADALRLRPLFGGGMFVNLTSHGHTVASAKAKIEEQLRAAQRACAHGAADGGGGAARGGGGGGHAASAANCRTPPAVRCRMEQRDRWERVGAAHISRYRAPHCDEWNVAAGDRFTLIAFHALQPQERQRLAAEGRSGPTLSWMHAGLYGLYVAPHGGGGGGKELPHALYYDDLMTKPSLINSLSSWWRHRFFDKH